MLSTSIHEWVACRKFSLQSILLTALPKSLIRNPVCQKLIAEGSRLVQCRNASYLVHHRWSPRHRPELAYAVYDEKGVSQLIALCSECHPSDDGTPHWCEATEGPIPPGGGECFVRTVFSITGAEDAQIS